MLELSQLTAAGAHFLTRPPARAPARPRPCATQQAQAATPGGLLEAHARQAVQFWRAARVCLAAGMPRVLITPNPGYWPPALDELARWAGGLTTIWGTMSTSERWHSARPRSLSSSRLS